MNAAPEKVCDCGGAIDCERCAERERVEAEARYTARKTASAFKAPRAKKSVAVVAADRRPLESNSICSHCGREAVGPKSLCGFPVITPIAWGEVLKNRYTAPAPGTQVRLINKQNRAGFTLTFAGDHSRIEHFDEQGALTDKKCETTEAVLREIILGGAALFYAEALPTATRSNGPDMSYEVKGEKFVADFKTMPPPARLAGIQDNLFEGATQPGQMGPVAAAQFILAGAATFTLRSKKTGVRYTYKVTLIPDQERRSMMWGVKYWVSLLTGPDNTGDFTYLGMIEGTRFRLTGKSRMPATAAPVKAITWATDQILNFKRIPDALEIWHEGRCGRCNRVLTVPESIAAGLGPECAGKLGL